MHEVLVNRLGGLSLPRKCVVRLTDLPDMTLDVYRGRKTSMQCNRVQFPLVAHLSTIFIAHCHLLSPNEQLDTTEILSKGHKNPSHPSLSAVLCGNRSGLMLSYEQMLYKTVRYPPFGELGSPTIRMVTVMCCCK